MPTTERNEGRRNGNGNGGGQAFSSQYDRDRDRGDRDRDRDRDRPDRDRGAWDDQSRYQEMAPGRRGEQSDEGERWGQRDDYERFDYQADDQQRGGQFGRRDDERTRRGGPGYGEGRGYGQGQSGYGAGYQPMRGRGEGSMGTGYGQGAGGSYGSDRDRDQGGMSGMMAGDRGGPMGYGSLGAGADTGPGSMGRWQGEGERDLSRTPSHRGKGPVGYARSDERIKEQVCEALTDDHHIDASAIHVNVKDGEVTLTGTVPERRMKRLAEDCVERMSGVKDVTNNIKCSTDASKGQQGQGQTTSSSQGGKESESDAARKRS